MENVEISAVACLGFPLSNPDVATVILCWVIHVFYFSTLSERTRRAIIAATDWITKLNVSPLLHCQLVFQKM